LVLKFLTQEGDFFSRLTSRVW